MIKKPVRMCILCRTRLCKSDLVRLQYQHQKIINYSYESRSFYACKDCAVLNSQVLKKTKKMFQNNNITLDYTVY